MKKIVLLLIAFLVIGGAAWGQATFPPTPLPAVTAPAPVAHAVLFMDALNAVQTLSTESRYSAGIFTSMVDDYIDVNRYNPQIGTFVFAGGYPARDYDAAGNTGGVSDTNYLTGEASNPINPNYALSLGLGKTFKSFYLGVYYGGSVIDAAGDETGSNKRSSVNWRNKTAVLLGTQKYGAFRLDMIIDTSNQSESNVGEISTPGPSFALTWGGIKLKGMDPYISIGYKFADKIVWDNAAGNTTYTGISVFGVQAGLRKDLDSTSYVSGDVAIGGMFGGKYTGATKAEQGNAYGINAAVGYKKIMDFGKFSFGFGPGAFLAITSDSRGDYSGDNAPPDLTGKITTFELLTGINLGAKFQYNPKLAFYTGASIQIFDWRTNDDSRSGATDSWAFQGLMISPDSYSRVWVTQAAGPSGTPTAMPPHGVLGFGTTITPVDNLVIGAGLNSLLDRIFAVNLSSMRIETNINPNGNSFLSQLFGNLVFDLTVSYKF